MRLDNLTNKKIGILGLGVTGISVYRYISKFTSHIVCWDDSESLRDKFEFRGNLKETNHGDWQQLDIIVISPGIPHEHNIFQISRKHDIRITSDVELFLAQDHSKSLIVTVTGTNGKSTTVSLINHIMNNAGKKYVMGGNIGVPVLDLASDAQGYVLELSSFQLDLLDKIEANISVLLNIMPDHLDRYNSYEDYQKSKLKILQNAQMKIIGIDGKHSKQYYNYFTKELGDPRVLGVSSKHGPKTKIISCNNNIIKDNFSECKKYSIPNLHNLMGKHNQENIAAAFAVCTLLGVSSDEIIDAITSFEGLKHRLQYLGTKQRVNYYNDSKATNSVSTSCALSSLKNIFWLAGGVFKEKDLNILDNSLKHVKKAYLFGKNREIFAKYLNNKIDYMMFETMEEAFIKAADDASSFMNESSLLLSPACASFDQFKNFQQRGNKFIELYNNEK
ncbi:MAG: hypothetical protein DGJ47_000412 [Rickettsiaceae bacterium]